MDLSNTDKIEIIIEKRGITKTELANRLGISKQNLYKKLHSRKLPESELRRIAEELNCTYESSFTLNDTGEKI
ncbi:MAG: helix-turn-helix transcriptional regulator [Clostridiales bacterium]|nr:helix-turn-helix transcriptional regulator [Clostridiales bacterium]